MRRTTNALFVGLIATMALLSALSTASARRIELSSQRFLAIWEQLRFSGTNIITVNVRCRVTLEGSFHSRTLSKVCGQLVGYITEANVTRPCLENNAWAYNGTERLPNGTATANTLPWHIRYRGFQGTLPEIRLIEVDGAAGTFLIEALGNSCTYAASPASPFLGSIAIETTTGTATELTAGGPGVPLIGGPGACPTRGTITGPTIRLGRQPEEREREYRPITVRLVQ